MKIKGHWPKNKRRNPEPKDWARIVAALNEAASRRQGRLIARKINVHVDTIRRWRKGIDYPHQMYVRPLVQCLYALKLYWERTGRQS